MNVTINQFLTVVVILLVTGCSTKDDAKIGLQGTQQNKAQVGVIKPSALDICKPNVGSPHYYRKAIFVADTTAKNDIARDLPGLANLTSQRLQTHLDELKRFKVSTAQPTGFASRDIHTAERVRQIGRQYVAQFVVKLEILDLTLHSPEGFLANLFEDNRRDVLITLYIYDAEHGALFYSQQFQDTVSGDVVGYPGFAGRIPPAWFNTDLGMTVDGMLKAMSGQINEQLACVPFATEVIAVSGDDIHINAGYLNGIKPGSSLQVYQRNELLTGDGVQKLEKKGGWILINTVLPNKSIANATEGNSVNNRAVTIGDIVRAW